MFGNAFLLFLCELASQYALKLIRFFPSPFTSILSIRSAAYHQSIRSWREIDENGGNDWVKKWTVKQAHNDEK